MKRRYDSAIGATALRPPRRTLALKATAIAWLLCALTVQIARAEPNPENSDATWRAHFNDARAAFSAQRYEAAKALLLKAAEIRSTPKILGNLAQVEVMLGDYKNAAKHASLALAELGRNAGVEDDLETAKAQVATLTVVANVEGASVTVDGEALGVTPLRTPLFLEPGTHQLLLTKSGYKSTPMTVTLAQGFEQRTKVELLQSPEQSAPSASNLPQGGSLVSATWQNQPPIGDRHTPQASRPNPFILFFGGVVTVAFAATGLGLTSRANSEYDQADKLRSSLGRSGCFGAKGSASDDCASLMDHRKSGDAARNAATVAFAVGGAAAVGTLGYWLWPRKKAAPAAGFRIEGAVTPQISMVTAAGSF